MNLRAPSDLTIVPGSPEHLQTISASKVPAIAGMSPHTSAVQLAAEMLGMVEPEQIPSHVLEYGQDREADLIRKFSKLMPEHPVLHHGEDQRTWVHPDHPNWMATPDGTYGDDLVEAKTSRMSEDWGKPGTSDIPKHHRVQATWQMICTGARTVWFIVDVMMEYRLYVVTWEEVEANVEPLIALVEEFEALLALGELPDWDGSDQTYRTVRRMHPDITPKLTVVVPEDLAYELKHAAEDVTAAEEALNLVKTKLTAAMDKAQYATLEDGTKVAGRQARGKAAPFIVADRGLKNLAERVDATTDA